MARLPRIVLPGIPHHVTQRGNNRQRTFFEEADYALYLDLLASSAERAQTEIWAYCLMPNHVHIILVPSDEYGLSRTFGELHRRYTGYVNARRRTTGHLWQGRFGSVAMDEEHLYHALLSIMRCAMFRLIRCGRGWWQSLRIGAGRAWRRILRERTIISFAWPPRWNGSVISGCSWARSLKRR
jgi:putative transposase